MQILVFTLIVSLAFYHSAQSRTLDSPTNSEIRKREAKAVLGLDLPLAVPGGGGGGGGGAEAEDEAEVTSKAKAKKKGSKKGKKSKKKGSDDDEDEGGFGGGGGYGGKKYGGSDDDDGGHGGGGYGGKKYGGSDDDGGYGGGGYGGKKYGGSDDDGGYGGGGYGGKKYGGSDDGDGGYGGGSKYNSGYKKNSKNGGGGGGYDGGYGGGGGYDGGYNGGGGYDGGYGGGGGKYGSMDYSSASSNLPFPSDPAFFLAEGVAALGGTAHAFYGVSAPPNVTTADGEPFGNMSIPFLGGFIMNVGAGSSKEGSFHVKLTVKDALLVRPDVNVLLLEGDEDREVKPSKLATVDQEKVQRKFKSFKDPLTAVTQGKSYTTDKKKFFKENLEEFFPAKLEIHFNVRGYMGAEEIATRANVLTNSEVMTLVAEVPSFPAKEMGFVLKKPVRLVDKNQKTVLNINQLAFVLIHEPEEKYCRVTVAARLSQKTVTDLAYALKPK